MKRIRNNVVHIFKFIYETDRSAFFTLAAAVVLSGMAALPSLYLPRMILNEFVYGKNYQNVIVYAICYAGLTLSVRALHQIVTSGLEKQTKTLEYEGIIRLFRKIADMDYDMLLDSETMDHFAKATKCVMSMNFYLLVTSLTRFFAGIFMVIVVMGILVLLDIRILLIVGVVIVIDAYANARMNKIRYRTDNELWPLDRRMTWFMRFAGDLKYAKDVRSNRAQDFLFSKYRNLSSEFYRLQNQIVDAQRNVKLIHIALTCLQEFLIYLILGFHIIVAGIFTVGDFSLVFYAMDTFRSGCGGMIDGLIEISNRGEYFKQYLDFIDIPGVFHSGKQIRYALSPSDDFEITFRNVSYRYPNQEKDALHDVSITMKKGEKLSIVGENGAGKTTFIKLLLRLYDPTQGAIYLNGTDIRDIQYEDYCRIFSTVFQDFNLFALTLRENLTLGNTNITDEQILEAANKIGFLHVIHKLPKQLDTMLYSDYDPQGVDLSGGEEQKTAILRMLLRRCNVMIMDEPTAALDPKAEDDIYKMIHESLGNQLMIYISHRLASARFCDRILLFAEGTIAEQGTHEQLMASDTAYRSLFLKQAGYYE